jgi:hypothetical protein
MAHTKECTEHIPVYTPREVFEIGTRLDTLPIDDGFTIASDSAYFAQGVLVQVGFALNGQPFSVNAKVEKFEPARAVLIKGSSWVGKAAVWFNLAPNDVLGGTDITYGVKIQHSLLTRAFEPLAKNHLDAHLPEFGYRYRQNVIDILDAERQLVA